ncbi:hypothetical protein PMAC_000264 [Pneumocystis sp. 'macacae']|nr:hypothetical protein PMAC_000264 [Pneumocystis sp. 'macacae']
MRRCLHGICVDFDSIGGGKNRINGFFLHVKGEQEEGGERCAPGDEMSVCTKCAPSSEVGVHQATREEVGEVYGRDRVGKEVCAANNEVGEGGRGRERWGGGRNKRSGVGGSGGSEMKKNRVKNKRSKGRNKVEVRLALD